MNNNFSLEPNSWVNRNGFPEWFMALVWVVVSFILFQLLGPIVFLVLLSGLRGVNFQEHDFNHLVQDHIDLLFWGNTTGQVIVILLGTLFLVRLHSGRGNRLEFIRWRWNESQSVATWSILSIVLVLCLQPTIWFLAWLNSLLPLPDSYLQLEQVQTQMLQKYLTGGQWLGLTLFHIALVPAICEEVLFRGYILRAVERSKSILMGLLVSGVLFGLYHLRLTQIIPLSLIGVLLAYITWQSGSLIPAIVAHFANNAGSILLVALFPDSSFAQFNPESHPPLWMVVLSVAISLGIFIYLKNYTSSQSSEVASQVST